ASALRRRTHMPWACWPTLRNVRIVPGTGSIGRFMNCVSAAWTWTVRAAGEPDGANETSGDPDGLASSGGDAAGDAAGEPSTDGASVAAGEGEVLVVPVQAPSTAPANATVAPRRSRVVRVIVTSEIRSRHAPFVRGHGRARLGSDAGGN